MTSRKQHVIVERGYTYGFQPKRWVVCRCGWRSESHYSRKKNIEDFNLHRELRNRVRDG